MKSQPLDPIACRRQFPGLNREVAGRPAIEMEAERGICLTSDAVLRPFFL